VYGTGKRKRFVGKDCDDDDDDAGRNTKDYKTDMAGDDAMLDIPLSTGSSMADNNDNTIDRCHYDDAVNDDKESEFSNVLTVIYAYNVLCTCNMNKDYSTAC
jgi:hypothetical protein